MAGRRISRDIADPALAGLGRLRIAWADGNMPVLRSIRERFERERPLEGLVVGACLHITTETANLLKTLKAGGATVLGLRLEPALDPGRRRRLSRRGRGHRDLRRQGRGSRPLLPAHRRRARRPSAADAGRRLRSGLAPAPAPAGSARRHGRWDRGDDDRRDPPPGHGSRRVAPLPDRGGQRRRYQASVRQPVRHRPVHARRHHPRNERAARRQAVRRCRLRLLRQGCRRPGKGHGRAS